MNGFYHYKLRTTDVPKATAFYSAVLGEDSVDIIPLHEQAVARGARTHWLGCINVESVEATVREFVARGATPLGPVTPAIANLRDVGGAMFSLTSKPFEGGRSKIVWHQLDSQAPERALKAYAEVFGWVPTRQMEVAGAGTQQLFAWAKGSEDVGSVGDTAAIPGIRPQWVFHFRVPSLEQTLQKVTAAGGKAMISPLRVGDDWMVLCDDAEGAGFGLRSRER